MIRSLLFHLKPIFTCKRYETINLYLTRVVTSHKTGMKHITSVVFVHVYEIDLDS